MFKYDVSVIVAVYNNEKYIKNCINSVLKQKYEKERIQIILVDDGSSDNSGKICEDYTKKYNNILLIHQKNRGVSAARNEGLKRAEGKYIMILDSDDFISESAVNDLVLFMEEHPELNIASYRIRLYKNGAESEHYRNKLYSMGTNVYDITKFPHLSQATINVIFRNEFDKNELYDENMTLAEDEKFNTKQIMKSGKIGYCASAKYYYRKHGTSVSATAQNPYYCFEQFINYFYYLIDEYTQKDGTLPQYIQGLILQMVNWRVNSNLFLPYYLEGEKYEKALAKIKDILQHIEVSTIASKPNMNIYHKIYVLKLKGITLSLVQGFNDEFSLNYNKEIVYASKKIDILINRFKIKNNKIYILGYIKSPICEVIRPDLYVEFSDGSRQKIEVTESNFGYYKTEIKTNTFYKFDCYIDMEQVNQFAFFIQVEKQRIPTHIAFSRWCPFCTEVNKVLLTNNKEYILKYNKKKEIIKIVEADKKKIKKLKNRNYKKYKLINSNINIYRYLAESPKEVWLYSDRNGVIDNAYYQFKHDINKNDGISRYYLVDGNIKQYKQYFSRKELRNHVIRRNSYKHKIMFLRSNKILVSFDTFSNYSPFKQISLKYYQDILHYEVIYLQHGILYANLIRMYSKELTGIDKIVISSEFEKQNFIKNYLYNEEDLICVGMPRFDIESKKIEKKNSRKIIFAPSWRKYLIQDPPIDGKRELLTNTFLDSKFYKEIMNILNSRKLEEILKEYNVTLEFKLHPIFEGYKKLFEIKSEYIKICEGAVDNQEYDLFITDFSSFQFDFARLKTPTIYFVPDLLEFKAGLHTYRKLDLPLEESFGDVTYKADDLINKIEYYIMHNFEIEEKYINRMESFFFETDNNREKIYQELMQEK